MTGTRIAGRYEVIRELGRGGGGVVFLARDTFEGRDVAVKLLPPDLGDFAKEERFKREAAVVARMSHPSIVPVLNSGEHDAAPFFVMPFIEGDDLSHHIRERSLTPAGVVEVGIQIASALDYSHEMGVVHRDIKPENIMVAKAEGGRVRAWVMDFGLARTSFFSERLTRKGSIVGTVTYFSPEQVLQVEVDGRGDLYSLGVVLYECLAGERPFTGPLAQLLHKIVGERPKPLREAHPEVPEALERAVFWCLEKDPMKRPQHGRDLVAALARVAP